MFTSRGAGSRLKLTRFRVNHTSHRHAVRTSARKSATVSKLDSHVHVVADSCGGLTDLCNWLQHLCAQHLGQRNPFNVPDGERLSPLAAKGPRKRRSIYGPPHGTSETKSSLTRLPLHGSDLNLPRCLTSAKSDTVLDAHNLRNTLRTDGEFRVLHVFVGWTRFSNRCQKMCDVTGRYSCAQKTRTL